MIVTGLDHIEEQMHMTPQRRKAVDFLKRTDLSRLADGRTEIDGDRVFALVQRYETEQPETPNFEFHRKYIDIQVVVTGVEVIGWTQADHLEVTKPYDGSRDVCFGRARDGAWTPVRLGPGQLAVLWPADAHAPKLCAGAPAKVMKVVVKVAV